MEKQQDGQVSMAAMEDSEIYASLRKLHARVLDSCGPMWNWPSALTLTRPSLARILYLGHLYEMIIDVPGVICEFGAHYGTTSAILTNLRAVYEPYNYSRTLHVFDTFEGFAGVTNLDAAAADGDFRLPVGYPGILDEVLSLHELLSPNSHIVKHQLHVGDASETVAAFLDENPQVVVSMAILDMDIYRPTRAVLESILPRMPRGSLIVFDELAHPEFPGETTALDEVLGIDNLRIYRSPAMPFCAWAVVGG